MLQVPRIWAHCSAVQEKGSMWTLRRRTPDQRMPQPRKTEVCELRKETPYMGHQMPSQDGPEGENKGQKGNGHSKSGNAKSETTEQGGPPRLNKRTQKKRTREIQL